MGVDDTIKKSLSVFAYKLRLLYIEDRSGKTKVRTFIYDEL